MRFTFVIIQRSKCKFMTFMQVHLNIYGTYIHYPPHILHLQIVQESTFFQSVLLWISKSGYLYDLQLHKLSNWPHNSTVSNSTVVWPIWKFLPGWSKRPDKVPWIFCSAYEEWTGCHASANDRETYRYKCWFGWLIGWLGLLVWFVCLVGWLVGCCWCLEGRTSLEEVCQRVAMDVRRFSCIEDKYTTDYCCYCGMVGACPHPRIFHAYPSMSMYEFLGFGIAF